MRLLTSARSVVVTTRLIASGLSTWALLGAGLACAAEPVVAPTAVETASARRDLGALRRAWLDQLDGLTATTRALAFADDTYEFVTRPNLPYVYAHYSRSQLTADGIDIVLIVDRRSRPLFWRRADARSSGGFSDAKAFLAQLPALSAPEFPGLPTLAGATRIGGEAALVIAMPIHRATRSGESPGWVIVGRTIDDARWHRYAELAHVTADVLDPTSASLPADVGAALMQPFTPVFRVEGAGIRGLMSVLDLNGHPLRVFSLLSVPPLVEPKPPPIERTDRPPFWLVGSGIALVVACTVLFLIRRRVRAFVRMDSIASPVDSTAPTVYVDTIQTTATADSVLAAEAIPLNAAASVESVQAPETGPTHTVAEAAAQVALAAAAATPGGPAARDLPEWLSASVPATPRETPENRLSERLRALGAVFRYQPQFDLQTGRVGGVETLMSVSTHSDGPSTSERVAELEAAGLGLALAARWLREACTARRFWLRHIGDVFPISIPVSSATFTDPEFPVIVRRILSECELPPGFLELQIPEAVLAQNGVSRAIAEIHAVGALIAIDEFSAGHSSLRGLATAAVSKLRVDPVLVRQMEGGTTEALLFRGIVGASLGLGITLCATGVDSPELAAASERHGCRLAQGAACGGPYDSDQFLELVRGSGVETASLPTLQLDSSTWQSVDAAVLS